MDRYQPAPLNTSAAALGPRDMGTSATYSEQYYQGQAGSAYTPSNIPQGTLGYQTASAGYGQPDVRPTQSYPTSGYHPTTAMMYNVPQAASAQNTPVYDTSHQYSRPPAGLPLMNPDVTTHYYQSGPTGVPTAASAMQSQTASSSASQTGYQQPSTLQNYANIASLSGMTPQTSATAEMGMEEQAMAVEEDPSESFSHYESTLREVFREIKDGDLLNAGETLLTASALLRDGVTRFGLSSDDARARPNRLGVWQDFNNAWLALLQRQKDMMELHQQQGQAQTLLSLEGLRNMGKSLIELCDVLERHGLVDYEMGVWEERIVDLLGECVALYERPGANASSSS